MRQRCIETCDDCSQTYLGNIVPTCPIWQRLRAKTWRRLKNTIIIIMLLRKQNFWISVDLTFARWTDLEKNAFEAKKCFPSALVVPWTLCYSPISAFPRFIWFFYMGQCRQLFVYFRPFYIKIKFQIEKSVDVVVGIRTRGRCRLDPLHLFFERKSFPLLQEAAMVSV